MRLIKCQPFNRCIQLNGEDSSIRRHHASSLLHPSFIDTISISLLTTILSLIAQQYQLNHVPPDSSYSLFLCTSLYIRTSQFDRSLLLNVLANLQGNFRGFCCRNSFSNSRKNIRLFLRCKYRIHDRIILRKIQE